MLLKRQVLFQSPPCKPCYVLFVQDCNITQSIYRSVLWACMYVQMTIHTLSQIQEQKQNEQCLSNPSYIKVKANKEKKSIWNFSRGSTYQRHANYHVNNWANSYFQKHYNTQYCNAEQRRILPSDKQVQQLLFASVGLQEEPKTEIPMCFSR